MSIRLGVPLLLWTNDDLPALGDETPVETCRAEVRRAGYRGVEIERKFPTAIDALGELLEHEGLALASGWYASDLRGRGVAAGIEVMARHVALMGTASVTVMVFCESTRSVHPGRARPVSRRSKLIDTGRRDLATRWDAVGRYRGDRGFKLAYHPTNTPINRATRSPV